MRDEKRRQSPAPREKTQPSVGILFVLGNQVLIESTPASEGEVYGDFFNHGNGHPDFWSRLQASGQVPEDQDYINIPRGRAVVNRLTGRPILYLDRCVSRKPALVREIKRRLELPPSTEISPDPHYRCGVCLSRSPL